MVIADGARGADTLAAEWAKEREVTVEVYLAESLAIKAGVEVMQIDNHAT